MNLFDNNEFGSITPLVNDYVNSAARTFGKFAVIFFAMWGLDFLPANSIAITVGSSEGLLKIVQFSSELLLRVAPSFIPIMIATTTLVINRYTGTLFQTILEDIWLKRLIVFYICYLPFHGGVIGLTTSDTNSLPHFLLLCTELLLITIALLGTFGIGIKIFIDYTLPESLTQKFTDTIRDTTRELSQKIDSQVLTEEQLKRLEFLEKKLQQYIGWFINLFHNAIKTKDFINVTGTLTVINSIYKELYLKLQEQDEKSQESTPAFNEISYKAFNNALEQLSRVYIETFETAFATKEFTSCKLVIEHLERLKDVSSTPVINILPSLFQICLTYKHPNDSEVFSRDITKLLSKIYKDNDLLIDYSPFEKVISYCIDFKCPVILNETLDTLKEFLDKLLSDKDEYKDFARILANQGIHCLRDKSMDCLAVLIRFLVTEKLNLGILNEVFSERIKVKKSLSEPLKSKILKYISSFIDKTRKDNPKDQNETSVYHKFNDEFEFDIDPRQDDVYLKLKFYVIWYSYYLLQNKISPDRIEIKNLTINTEIRHSIQFCYLRTLMLDLETHIKKWDKLFILQSKKFLIQTIAKLLRETDVRTLYVEADEYQNVSLLKTLQSCCENYYSEVFRN